MKKRSGLIIRKNKVFFGVIVLSFLLLCFSAEGILNFIESYSSNIRSSSGSYSLSLNQTLNDGVLVLDGTGDFMRSEKSVAIGPNVTVSAWVKRNAIGGTQAIFGVCRDITSYCTDGDYSYFIIRFDTENKIFVGFSMTPTFGVSSSSKMYAETSLASYTDTNWHHIVVVVEGGSTEDIKLYVDGSNVSTSLTLDTDPIDLNINESVGVGATYITYRANSSSYFNGAIDELMVWNRTLNSTEVQTLYNSGNILYADSSVVPFNSGLVVGWNFSKPSGETYIPSVSGANDGVLYANAYTNATPIYYSSGSEELFYDISYFSNPLVMTKDYLMDDRILNVSNNTNFVFGLESGTKYAGNPIFNSGADLSLSDIGWAGSSNGNVLFINGSFHLYYISYNSAGTAGYVFYANSSDGINWVKPNLSIISGYVPSNSSAPNNAIFRADSSFGYESNGSVFGVSIIYRNNTQDENKRYIMMYLSRDRADLYNLINLAFSADGVNFTRYKNNPVYTSYGIPTFLEPVSISEYGDRFVIIGQHHDPDVTNYRRIISIESSDKDLDESTTWTFHRQAMNPPNGPGGVEFYHPEYFALEDNMTFGSVGIYNDSVNGLNGHITQTLMYTRNGVNFSYFNYSGTTPPASYYNNLIDGGNLGEFDFGMVFGIGLVNYENKTYLYYTGWNGTHNETFPKRVSRLGLKIYDKDRITYVKTKGTNSNITSSFVRLQGKNSLVLNVFANSTDYLQVELLSRNGSVISGYSKNDCDVINMDSLNKTVTWNGDSNLPSENSYIRFYFTGGAKLYTLALSEGENNIPGTSFYSGYNSVNVSTTFVANNNTTLNLSLNFYNGTWNSLTQQVVSSVNNFRIPNNCMNISLSYNFSSDSAKLCSPTLSNTSIVLFNDDLVILNSPSQGYSSTNESVGFGYSAYSNGTALDYCELFINNTLYATNSSPIIGASSFFNVSLNNSSGYYGWYISCTDVLGGVAYSKNRTLSIDKSAPNISYYPSDGFGILNGSMNFSANISDDYNNVDNATFNLFNLTSLVLREIFSTLITVDDVQNVISSINGPSTLYVDDSSVEDSYSNSSGTFINTELEFSVYPYKYASNGVMVFSSSSAYFYFSDYSETEFGVFLDWLNVDCDGYIVQAVDYSNSNNYWFNVSSVDSSLFVSDFSSWESGSYSRDYTSPYEAVNLYGDQEWRVYAEKERYGDVTFSNYSTITESNFDNYWSTNLSWDVVDDADAYLVYSVTNNYWIETENNFVYDDGFYVGWTYGGPNIEHTSPHRVDTASIVVFSVVGLIDGIYSWFWSASDMFGNEVVQSNKTLIVDSVAPTISITNSFDDSYENTYYLNLEYSIVEDNVDSCWYNIGDGNVTTSCSGSVTLPVVVGTNIWTIYVNDTSGQIDSANVSFSSIITSSDSDVGSSTSYLISQNLFESGFNKNVGKNYVWRFSYKNQTHTITFNNISNSSINFTVQSTPQKFSLKVNESVLVDIEKDGIYDLNVSYNKYFGSLANVGLKKVNVSYIVSKNETSIPQNESEVSSGLPSEEKSYLWVGVAVLTILVTAYFILRRKKIIRFK